MNDQSIGSLCRSRHHIRVPARTGASVRTNPIIVSRPWLQSGYSSAIDIANIEVVVAVHVTAERVAGGDVQEIAFRAAYAGPTRHEAAARRRRRRNSFNTRGNLISVPKLGEFLQSRFQPDPGLVRRGTGLEWCAGSDVLLRRIDVLCGELPLLGAIDHAFMVSPAVVGLRQREWNGADGDK